MSCVRITAAGVGARRCAARSAWLGGVSLVALLFAADQGEARSLNSTGAVAATAAAAQAAAAAAQQGAAAGAQAQASLARAAAALAVARQAQQSAAALAAPPQLANGRAIPLGIGSGGLMPTGGVTDVTGSIGCGTSCTTFQLNTPQAFNGADSKLTQTLSAGQTKVNVTQTQQQAIYNWDSFNISPNTVLNFTQQASNWVALNRVNPNTSPVLFLQNATSNNGRNNPSYIGGQITAPGAVYVINRNGIIFGAGAQINVQSLVASTLDVGKLGYEQTARDQYFLNTGIGNQYSFSVFVPVRTPTTANPDPGGAATTTIPGNVTVQAGASITANIATDVVPRGSPGFVYLFGANVYNYGTLTAPQGEVAMAASRAITLTPGSYQAANFPSNVLPSGVTFRGTGLQLQNFTTPINSTDRRTGYDNDGNPLGTSYYRDDVNHIVAGEVSNGGLIETRQGVTLLAGDRVAVTNLPDAAGNAVRDAAGKLVSGVISADTSVGRNGMVLLHAATSVQMDGVISMLPYDDGNRLPMLSGAAADSTASSVQSYMPAYVEMSAQRSVVVGASGLVSAPSATVLLNAVKFGGQLNGSDNPRELFNGNGGTNNEVTPSLVGSQQVLLRGSGADGPGATIDVAGLQDVVLPASYNFISFAPRAEFADMPLQRNGALYGKTLWIDIRASGTRSDGTTWVGTPLADASGVIGAVGRSINQLMTAGGKVSLTTDLAVPTDGIKAPNRQAIAQSGSVINVAGGKITFLPGMVPSTRLLGIDGRIYSMANADPNMVYLGIAGQFSVEHSRWGVTETWSSGGQTYSPGYTEGHDAGGVTVTTINPQLNPGGEIYFGSVAGLRQIAQGLAPSNTSDSTSGTKTDRPTPLQAKGDELPSQGYLELYTPSSVRIGDTPSANFNTQNALTQLSADTLSGYGLSALKIVAYDLVVSSGSALNLAAGGQFSATVGGAIDVAGKISAAGGSISLSTDRYQFGKTFAKLANASGVSPVALVAPTSKGEVIAANVFVEGLLDVSGRFVNDTGRFDVDASGPAFINGGSISIYTKKGSLNGSNTTGSILLASGSVFDASSGGYISAQGKPKTVTSGVMAGKGGSISFTLARGSWNTSVDTGGPEPDFPQTGQAMLQLGGILRAYGFESNGSLRVGATDTIRIGGSLQPGETSNIRFGQASTIPVEALSLGGFGSYTFESIPDGYTSATANVIVSAGANLTLQQRNLSSLLDYQRTPTGTKLGSEADGSPATRLSYLPGDQRKSVDLAFKADNILLDAGASIVTDPRATITLGGSPSVVATLQLTDPKRDTPANSVVLRGRIVDHGGKVIINALRTTLDNWASQQQARIDLSGTYIASSLFGTAGGPTASGTLVSGGRLEIESAAVSTTNNLLPGKSQGSYVVAGTGLQVDVSGYAGAVEVVANRGSTSSAWVWSDAGTVSADVTGFVWNGSFNAHGGRYIDAGGRVAADPRANGGTIILGGGTITLGQNFDPGQMPGVPSTIFAATDRLSAFENVFLYSGNAEGGAARIFTDLPGNTANLGKPALQPLTIAGSLSWQVSNRLQIAASSITTSRDGSNVTLAAPYVLLTGGDDAAKVKPGTSTITVSANQAFDIEGAAFSGFKQVELKSAGDMRLSTPKVANTIGDTTKLVSGPSTFPGVLATYGDLLVSAQRIYPVSAVNFTIQSTAGNVSFSAPAGSNPAIPLSAGGSLTVTGANIFQGGNLFAPLGNITLTGGTGTNSDGTLQGVTLLPGSLTSVTLVDTVVPYGATADGTGWYYNASAALTQPPAKGLTLSGASVAVTAGSVIDERGGGDLQAMEWIQGKGGSHDTLTTVNGGLGATGSLAGPTVYALVPSKNDAVAAFDIHFTAASSLNADGKSGTPFTLPSGQVLYLQSGDVYPLAGSQITIAGGAGIPAGTYTLYPAHYATLPGALRVTYYGDNLGRNVPSGTTLPDGTVLVTGNYTQSTQTGKQSSGQSLFAVQTGTVWQQYSEYGFSSANSYFVQKAAHDGTNVPRLPVDAGRLAVIAQQQILLAGVAVTQPAPGGRGGELDIAGAKLAVVGHQQYVDSAIAGNVPTGYIPLDVSQLNSFGFESILIGGTRSDVDPTKGTLITATATSVQVDTRGQQLTAPEILLVTQAAGQWVEQYQWLKVGSTLVYVPMAIYKPTANDGSVVIKAGSIIETSGTVHSGYGRNYYFAAPLPTPLSRAQEVAEALGGTLQADGKTITGIDLNRLHAFWYWNNWTQSAETTRAGDPASMNYYPFGGPTTKQPGLGSLFAASNDPNLVLSGPTGNPVQQLTLQFADLSKGAVPGVPDSGPVTALDGTKGQIVLPAGDAGRVTIEAGATISTNTLSLQATASTNAITFSPGDLHVKQGNLTAQTIAIGSKAASAAGASVQLTSQFGDAQGLTLKALSGAITVYGTFDSGQVMTSLILDAAAVARAAGSADGRINVPNGTIKLMNDTVAAVPAALPSSSGNLAFAAADIVLGGGTQTLAGAAAVTMSATDRVFIAGPGKLTLGTGTDQVNLTVTTPTVLVAGATATNSGSFTLTTQGDVTFADIVTRTGTTQRPTDSPEIGGNLAVVAKTIAVGNTIQAQAGTVTLEATGADVVNQDGSIARALRLTDGAYIAAGGYTKTLLDVTTYVAGGRVLLQADPAGAGGVLTAATSVIDVAQPADGVGYGGRIQISATAGRAVLLGDLHGRGGNGLGGSFKVDTNALQVDSRSDSDVKLDALADRLLAGGLSGAIDIHTRTGNLTLSQSHKLKGNSVTLTADDTNWNSADATKQFGQITVAGTIDASGYAGTTADGTGQAGGQVGLYAANQVTLAGTSLIDASTAHTDERGGDVTVGIPWAAQGKIRLQSGMHIDVSGGTKGGLSGGTVTFRTPVDGNGGAKIVAIDADGKELSTFDSSNIHIKGARSVTVEGFIAFDTIASKYGLDGSNLGNGKGKWDGLIDPAGLYGSDGKGVLTGSWTNVNGYVLNIIDGGQYTTAQQPYVLFYNSQGRVMGSSRPTMVADGQGGWKIGSVSLPSNIQPSQVPFIAGIAINGGTPVRTASATLLQGSIFTGQTQLVNGTYKFTPDNPNLTVIGTYDSANPQNSSGTFTPTSIHAPFFAGTLVSFAQGTLKIGAADYGFNNLIAALSPLAQQLGAGVVHVRPGIELVNSDPTKNSGNIVVKSAWNLAAGSAYNLQSNLTNGNKYVQVYDSSVAAQQSYVTFDYRLVADYGIAGSSPAIEPGALTLRSANNIVIGASISDGFFQFNNYLDANYVAALATYLSANHSRGIDPSSDTFQYYLNSYSQSPIAPYNSAANVISPSAKDLAAADLFPNRLRVCILNCGTAGARIVTVTDPGSWTYRITAGADLNSGNPNAVKPLDSAVYNPKYTQAYNLTNPSQTPSVIVTGTTSYAQSYYSGGTSMTTPATPNVTLPTMVRTGTGGINVTAAYDVFLTDPDPASLTANTSAPGAIYAAGVNTPRLTDPNYQLRTVNGVTTVVPTADPSLSLFFEPQLLAYGSSNGVIGTIYGPPTAAAFPHMGGDVDVAAQNDIIGYRPVTSTTSKSSYQYFKQWLLADAELTPAQDANSAASINVRGEGAFAPTGTSIASQTAWWIEYGSFQQGILSAGGNVTATAGRDVNDLSVSLPTTGRVSGGLTATSTPVTHVYDSGNMTVSAGRDILGGSFYEGSGHASIVAGRSVGKTTEQLSWQGLDRLSTTSSRTLDNVPLLAVDLGRIQLTAGGSIAISGVINPAALHLESFSYANIGDNPKTGTAIYMDTYGPQSGVSLLAVNGNVTIGIAPTAIDSSSSSVYPASFSAVALGGDLKTTGLETSNGKPLQGFTAIPGMVLSGSESGDFRLVAAGSIDLTFGSTSTIANSPTTVKPYISAGPALLDTAFDPFRPDAWYGTHSGDTSYAGAFSSALLSHQNDPSIARIIAATGNIVGSGKTAANTGYDTGFTRVEINRPTEVYAGGNITDLNLIVQNIRSSDVSSVIAGGNISYTGSNIAGGLQVAGPGSFVVQAGGDLGPFLPVAADNTTLVRAQQGIASVGNASITPVGNAFSAPTSSGGLTGIYNAALLGSASSATKRRNALLSASGADIIALFGVKKGIDYQAVINAYVDPSNAANVAHNYFAEMLAFLARVNTAPGADPLATFTSLPEDLQRIFVDQVFFAELKAVGQSDLGKAAAPRGYKMIETMFPSSLGYTANDGSSPVATGDLNLLHSTIQTRLGGDISIFGPGGSILVGPLATEPNPNLKLSDLGILTLGGGAINTFTDQNVLVNSSRVLTTQGGDVLMWSSNGNLDAGRGSKTTLSQPPLQVLFDSNDYESVDLGGYVTGAGIGTVQASYLAKPSSLYLLAPRGTVDFGVAGGRSSGNLVVVAPVVANVGNIQVQGTSTGIPAISVPNVSGLTSAGNSAAAATKSSDTPTAGGNRDRASVFIVEVVGYGGGDYAGSNPAPAGENGPSPGSAPSAQNSDDRKKAGGQQ